VGARQQLTATPAQTIDMHGAHDATREALMNIRRTIPWRPVLLLMGIALTACGGEGSTGTTITSTADGIVGEEEAAEEAAEEATEEAADEATEEAADDDVAPDSGPSGSVTIDGVEYALARIERCVPTDQTAARIEEIDGIDSLDTLNLVASGEDGLFEMYYADVGMRSVTLRWSGAGEPLEVAYTKVTADADWIDGQGTRADGDPLMLSEGIAIGGGSFQGLDVSFELPIPQEASC